jgi:hypothetical protein
VFAEPAILSHRTGATRHQVIVLQPEMYLIGFSTLHLSRDVFVVLGKGIDSASLKIVNPSFKKAIACQIEQQIFVEDIAESHHR